MENIFYNPWIVSVGSAVIAGFIIDAIKNSKKYSKKSKIFFIIVVALITIIIIVISIVKKIQDRPTDPGIWVLSDGSFVVEDDFSLNSCDHDWYDCKYYSTQEKAQMIYESCSKDIHQLDRDNDGIACETLP